MTPSCKCPIPFDKLNTIYLIFTWNWKTLFSSSVKHKLSDRGLDKVDDICLKQLCNHDKKVPKILLSVELYEAIYCLKKVAFV